MAEVCFTDVFKRFPDGTTAVRDLSLHVRDGELMVLVGPSGCGKTTALRMVAGLEGISEGTIAIDNRVVNGISPRDRDVAMVFQNYALYPNKNVFDNLAFPLRIQRLSKTTIRERVGSIARLLELEGLLDRKPRQLSGGQRQRVAMGRAMVRQPKVYLMDEPLSNLDAKLRAQMRAELSLLHRELGITTLFVTHDQVEAMTLGERVAVMRGGELQQVGAPQALYEEPVNRFVAGFIGNPATNLVEGELVSGEARPAIRIGNHQIELDAEEVRYHGRLDQYMFKRIVMGVRPEHLVELKAHDRTTGRTFDGLLKLRESLGSEVLAHLAVDGVTAIADDVEEVGEDATYSDTAEAPKLAADHGEAGREHNSHGGRKRARRTDIVARFDSRSFANEGDETFVQITSGAVRLFDKETGLALTRPK